MPGQEHVSSYVKQGCRTTQEKGVRRRYSSATKPVETCRSSMPYDCRKRETRGRWWWLSSGSSHPAPLSEISWPVDSCRLVNMPISGTAVTLETRELRRRLGGCRMSRVSSGRVVQKRTAKQVCSLPPCAVAGELHATTAERDVAVAARARGLARRVVVSSRLAFPVSSVAASTSSKRLDGCWVGGGSWWMTPTWRHDETPAPTKKKLVDEDGEGGHRAGRPAVTRMVSSHLTMFMSRRALPCWCSRVTELGAGRAVRLFRFGSIVCAQSSYCVVLIPIMDC